MPSEQRWWSVCYGNGKFVAVSISNVFAYSTDGVNWTEGTLPSDWRILNVVYFKNNFYLISSTYIAPN